MNKVLVSLLFSAFFLTVSSYAQTPAPAAAVVPAVTEKQKPAHHEHHPAVRNALKKLRGAKQDLEKAAHDFGGHKVKAIAAIDQAIEELKSAMEFDKK